ncbi:cell division protein FtsQ/DivIB [Massilia sp. PAMC28688]|uniref:cell division protein FtsQ/DivIB n=1 Tax=Massilia sp. PAMC28688 TaxID=2861283 RepID=UPI001C62E0BF|nr:cell division protein FtsQ/DivIB [Massilia sp. PAMC28688]QYF94373.1 cell division protein FtsQ/DivIB [Massilia sp. PAMC28688]
MWHDVRALNASASGLVAAVVLALIASGVWWVSQRPVFTLRTVTVESMYGMELKHVNKLTLRAGVVGRIKGNFFTTNLEQVRTAFESVPWVRRATVRREWPDQLIVEVEEHEPLGTWGEDGRLLSVKGDVFTANLAEADEDRTLPELGGPDGSEQEVLARFAELRAWFAPLKLAPQKLHLSSRYAWTVTLDNGMRVALGREQDKTTLKKRVDRLVHFYPVLAERLPDGIESVDMRYQNGMALTASGLKIPEDGKKPAKPAAAQQTVTSTSRRNQLR